MFSSMCVMKLRNCLNKQNSSRIIVAKNDEIRSHAREFHERISEEKNVQSSFKKELKSLILDTHSIQSKRIKIEVEERR